MSEAAMLGARGTDERGVETGTPSGDDPRYARAAESAALDRTAESLRGRGFDVVVVPDPEAARREVLAAIPEGAGVFTASSQSLESSGIRAAIEGDPRFRALRPTVVARVSAGDESGARTIAAAPDVVVGSVHAVTEDGVVMVASASGSQIPAYAYGAGNVLWVVGSQKIVRDVADGFRRIEEHTFRLEDARARETYGRGSVIAKILLVYRELKPHRVRIVLVREPIGF
ncbi:MAG TPA: LUD domain-containing protein [Thermoplasmata archaeon]|nr:LUD domain-containing protein [Thermoplasmata archaeon]